MWLVFLAGCAVYANGWPTDNRIERWGAQLAEDPGWERLRTDFGGDEAVLVRLDRFDPQAARDSVMETVDALAAGPGVLEAIDAPRILGVWPWAEGGGAPERALVETLDLWDEGPARLDLILRIRTDALPEERALLAEQIAVRARAGDSAGYRLRAAGHPLVSAALDHEARRVERTFVPLLVVLAALGAGAFLRSGRLAIVALLPAATASVAVRAFARAFVGPSDLILVAVGPITFVVVFAASLHLVLRFQLHASSGRTSHEAARLARQDKATATLLAAATTGIGFAVFRLSALRSVVDLGTLVAGTVALSAPLILLGGGALLGQLQGVRGASASGARPWRRLAAWSIRRRGAVAAVGGALLVSGAVSPRYLEAATNGVHYFDRDHPVRRQFEEIEQEGTCLSSAEVLMEIGSMGETSRGAWTAGALRTLNLAERLAAVPGAEGVVGPEMILDTVGVGLGALTAPVSLRKAGRLDASGAVARWTVRFATGESDATNRMLAGLGQAAREADPSATVFVSGSVPRLHAMQDTLVGTLALSLALTLLVTTCLFGLVTRSLREVAAVVAVNLVPVASVLSFAAWLRIPLDGATTMVAAVVLGLAVDNTFHLIHAAGPAPRSNRSRLRAFSTVGGAATVGSISLALGFSTLLLSGFAPTARFGGLSAIGAIAAWLADTMLLPALLPWRRTPVDVSR